MRLVTSVAGCAAGVFGYVHLWEALRFGGVRLMAAGTKDDRIQLGWGDRRGIIRVRRQRSMTGFTSYAFVHSLALNVLHFGMATFADLMPRIIDGQRCDVRDGICTIMPVSAKAARD
jgi:hypothetical protein